MKKFNDFVHKYILKSKTTSNIKNSQVFCSIGFNNVGIYLRDGQFDSDIGIVNLHLTKRTHWVCYIHENFLDSYGCVCPKKISRFIITRNGHCLYCDNNTRSEKKEILIMRVFVYIYFT